MDLYKYLIDLEKRINPEQENMLLSSWESFADLDFSGEVFSPSRRPVSPGIEWPKILINDAFNNMELMIYSQLRLCSEALARGSGDILSVRPNYGTGIIPAMFGAELFLLDREIDTLPSTRPLPEGGTAILELIENNKYDYTGGLAGKVFEFADKFREEVKDYPRISEFVKMYNPDLQGPFSLCESMWGSDIYIAMYELEDEVRAALDFFTRLYIDFTEKWHEAAAPYSPEYSVEWGMLHRGHTIIRNDSAMNISGEMYAAFVQPCDAAILSRFGGGIHFCGRGDHYIEQAASIPGLSVFNLSQPELNDMEKIYQATVDRGLLLIGLNAGEVERAESSGRNLRGRVHKGTALSAWKQEDQL